MDFGEYGKTWWTKKWLEAILSHATEQAVSQGIRFAQGGRVSSINIIDSRIISVVKGTNGGSHNNYVIFPRFSKDSCDLFLNFLRQQPAELLALNNGALNPTIEILMAKSGIQLFNPNEMVNMGCDCRDDTPCKYLVATFLKIAESACEDPNILFKIHGLDLKSVKDSNYEQLSQDAATERSLIRTIDNSTDLIHSQSGKDVLEVPPENELDHAEDASESLFGGFKGAGRNSEIRTPPQRLPSFNYDTWKNYSRVLPSMLQNFPKFCSSGNFRKSFADELESCRKFFLDYENFNVFAEHFRAYNSKTFLMERESLRLFHRNGWHWRFEQMNDGRIIKSDLTVSNIMGALCCLSEGNFSWHHYSVRYLHLLLNVAFHLVRTGAIYPQVFWIQQDVAQMRWLPAEMFPDVLGIVSDLEAAAPKKFIWTSKDETFVEMAGGAEHVLSLFISQMLRFARTYKSAAKTNRGNLLSFFFDNVSGRLANKDHDIPGKIQQWFSVYSSLDFRAQILFSCIEDGDGVDLDVFVLENSENADGFAEKRVPLSELFESNDTRLLSVLNILNGIADTLKPLGSYLDQRAESPMFLEGSDLLEFLQQCMKKLEILGIRTEIPRKLLNIGKPKAKMRLQGSFSFGAFNAKDLLDFEWEIAIGDENLPADEFLRLAEKADGLLKYRSEYVQITEQDLDNLRKQVEGKGEEGKRKKDKGGSQGDPSNLEEEAEPEITQAKLVQACFTGECDNIPVEMAGDFKKQFDAWRAETEISLPENLNATLRPYQVRGYSWMYKNLEIGFGCILADDMGMGKTLQVIAYLLKIKQEGKLSERKAIVVVPAGLLCNWQMEIRKFAPDLKFFAYHGGNRDLQNFNADVLLTTYSTFRRDYALLNERPWQLIVIDEAQNIKNADSEQSRLLRKMRAPMKIAMSGTPVENRLMEFWTIMDFANRGIFCSPSEFREKFEIPIQKNGDEKAAETLRKIAAPFMLRRLKTDKSIISDLPDKIIQDEYAELTASQAALYQKTLEHFMKELEMEQELSEAAHDSHALFKRKGIILQMILALKQICNHPATFLKLDERDDGFDESGNEKENGLNESKDGLDESGADTRDERENKLNESGADTVSTARLSSGKMLMLLDLLKSIQDQGEKTLIFTQFAEMGFLLQDCIKKELGVTTHFYHGGCTQTQRNSMVKDFQENPECKILILSLKAGGTGLNLTAASQVIHYDLWWNPAIEAQATDRAFRIGQTRNVQVHRFITKGTFEEKINALLESKKAVANMTVNAGETWLANMSDKEIGEVFRLDNTLV